MADKDMDLRRVILLHFLKLNLFPKFTYFNWRIIALQCCVGFCHTSTWIAIDTHMFPLSWTPLPPPIPSHPSKLSQSTGFELTVPCSKFPLAIYFTYGNVYVSILLSQFIPPSPAPSVSTSLFSISASPEKGDFKLGFDISSSWEKDRHSIKGIPCWANREVPLETSAVPGKDSCMCKKKKNLIMFIMKDHPKWNYKVINF